MKKANASRLQKDLYEYKRALDGAQSLAAAQAKTITEVCAERDKERALHQKCASESASLIRQNARMKEAYEICSEVVRTLRNDTERMTTEAPTRTCALALREMHGRLGLLAKGLADGVGRD